MTVSMLEACSKLLMHGYQASSSTALGLRVRCWWWHLVHDGFKPSTHDPFDTEAGINLFVPEFD